MKYHFIASKVNIKKVCMQGKKFDVKLFYPLIIRQLQNGIFQKFDTPCFFLRRGVYEGLDRKISHDAANSPTRFTKVRNKE